MAFTWASLAYIKKNFYLYATLAAVPSILFGIYSTPFNTALFWLKYKNTEINDFGSMLNMVLNPSMLFKVYPIVVAVFALVLTCSMWFNTMEQHLKVGKLSLSSPLMGINYTIIPVVSTIFVLSLILIILKIIVASLAFVIHELFYSPESPLMSNILIAVVAIAMVFLFIGLFLSIVLWIPGLIMSGYSFADMLVYCLRLTQNEFLKLYSGIAIPLICTLMLYIVLAMFDLTMPLVIFFNIIMYMCWFMYLQSYSMIAYFSLTNIERRDNVDNKVIRT